MIISETISDKFSKCCPKKPTNEGNQIENKDDEII